MLAAKPENSFHKVYMAGLIATAPLLPGAAILCAVAIYLTGSGRPDKFAPLWGAVIVVVAWLALAYVCRGFAKAENAVPSSYRQLRLRVEQLKAELAELESECPQRFENNPSKAIAIKEVEMHLNKIEHDLQITDASWVLATGYSKVWERLYRGEEALIEVAPQATVLAGAVYDDLRLQDSKINTREELRVKLQQAVTVIEPNAARYLTPPAKVMAPLAICSPSVLPKGSVDTLYRHTLVATGGMPPYRWEVIDDPKKLDGLELSQMGRLSGVPITDNNSTFTVRVTDNTGQMAEKPLALAIEKSNGTAVKSERDSFLTKVTDSTSQATEEKMARAVLRMVRRSINEFRNQSWNGQILLRNHRLQTMIYTGLTVFVLLSTAMIWEAKRSEVLAASVFFLVGAAVGLFDRLRRESEAETAVDYDYGLSAAQLVIIPLFSGLGAVGGVLLMAMLPFSTTVFAPKAAPSVPSALVIRAASPLPPGEVAKAYFEMLEATDGVQPHKWTVSRGAIPDGLVLSDRGLLSGTPTNDGTGEFTVRVTDGAGVTLEKQLHLTINKKTQNTQLNIRAISPLPSATVDRDYAERLQAIGSEPPYTWEKKSAMPEGLELSPSGLLSGKPKKAVEAAKIVLQVKDKYGQEDSKDFDLAISQYEPPHLVSTAEKSPSEQIPTLGTIFDLDKNLIGLLVAALFGLTPGLFLQQLQQQADKYKADLKSSQATEGTQKTDQVTSRSQTGSG